MFRYLNYDSGMSEGKVIIKPVYGGHFGRRLEFPRAHKGDSWGLLVSDSSLFLDLSFKNQLVT